MPESTLFQRKSIWDLHAAFVSPQGDGMNGEVSPVEGLFAFYTSKCKTAINIVRRHCEMVRFGLSHQVNKRVT